MKSEATAVLQLEVKSYHKTVTIEAESTKKQKDLETFSNPHFQPMWGRNEMTFMTEVKKPHTYRANCGRRYVNGEKSSVKE